MKEKAVAYLSTVKYCILLSWNSSKFYTTIRLVGKIISPFYALIISFLTKYIIDILAGTYSVSNKFQAITLLISLVGVFTIAYLVLSKILENAESLHNDILEKHITISMMNEAISADFYLFDNPTYYDKFTLIIKDMNQIIQILWMILDCISSFITIICVFFILFDLSLTYTALIIVASIPSAITTQYYIKQLYGLSKEQMNGERKKQYLYYISTDKSYAQDVRLYDIGDVLKRKYEALWENLFDKKRKMTRTQTIMMSIFSVLPEIVILFITLTLAYSILQGRNTIGDYSLYTGLLSQLLNGITLFVLNNMRIYDNKLRIDNLESFKKIPKLVTSGTHELNDVRQIVFQNVTFSYPDTTRKIIDHVSFKIESKEKVALVGLNGSGKTTLIKLLLRYYDVDEGEILINGCNCKEYTLSSLRKCFTSYFQNAKNYSFSLRENMEIGNRDEHLPEAEIMKALEYSGANSALKKCVDGLDTYVTRYFEKDGIELSGGENQKLALARTFARKASVIIMDEPSSSLDPESEDHLFKSISEICSGKMGLLTSHRLSNIALADKIIVLENGKIVEEGTREELLKMNERFATLYKYQADKYVNY